METIKVKAIFEADIRRFHRFTIKSDEVTGTLYIPCGEEVPDVVEVQLRTKAEGEARE